MNPLSLHVLVVTTTPRIGKFAVRAFVDTDQALLRGLGDKLVSEKPVEALHVSYELAPAEGVS